MTFDSKNRYRNIKDAHADELENIVEANIL